jgi:hypothetical protein
MKNRPLPVIITAVIFMIAGFLGIAYHSNEYFPPSAINYELALSLFIRVLAIACGLLLLRRIKWARWLAIIWLVYHVVLSLFHSVSETIVHIVFLLVISFLLFMPKSSAYFNSED